jgi:hypothetical protein
MRFPRLWRQADTCRLVLFNLSVRAAAVELSQTVVDHSGLNVPRVHRRPLDPSDTESDSAFDEESGRFELTSAVRNDGRVEAGSLP